MTDIGSNDSAYGVFGNQLVKLYLPIQKVKKIVIKTCTHTDSTVFPYISRFRLNSMEMVML